MFLSYQHGTGVIQSSYPIIDQNKARPIPIFISRLKESLTNIFIKVTSYRVHFYGYYCHNNVWTPQQHVDTTNQNLSERWRYHMVIIPFTVLDYFQFEP